MRPSRVVCRGLRLVSWNTESVALGAQRSFLDQLSQECMWDVLLLSEFVKPTTCKCPVNINGHRVFYVINPNRKPAAIIINSSLSSGTLDETFVTAGSSGGVALRFRGDLLWLVVSHLDANSRGEEYEKSLNDTDFVISSSPPLEPSAS